MKIAVGISGGVDSAVAALLLRDSGHELVGVTMALGRPGEDRSIAEAREVADWLKIPLKVFDFSSEWHSSVCSYIRDTYFRGQTPNPCVQCNESVKFSLLPRAAFDLGCDRFATGHYAILTGTDPYSPGTVPSSGCQSSPGTVPSSGCLRLFKGVDRGKDQSYFLYRVKPEILEKTIFPLGKYRKSEITAIAVARGLELRTREESQDFCGGDISSYLGTVPVSVGTVPGSVGTVPGSEGTQPGNVVRTDGKVIGRHEGFWKYTVGQRKGLGIGGGGIPYYVVEIRPKTNEIVVGTKECAIKTEFAFTDAVWLPGAGTVPESLGTVPELRVKVRSAGEPRGPVMIERGDSPRTFICRCPEGIFGVAPGQSAVFYRGDEVLGGGIIVSGTISGSARCISDSAC